MISAIIFDCDGTLVDSEYSHFLSWKHALKRLGGDLTEEEYTNYVGRSSQTNAKLFAQKFGCSNHEQVIYDKSSHFLKLLKQGLPPISPTVNFLHRLYQEKPHKGFKLAVASASPKEEILLILDFLGIHSYFDVILSGVDDLQDYSDPEGVNKPKPYIYQHAAKLLDVDPKSCIVIEDSHTGVEASVKAECFTIAVPNSYSKMQDFSKAHIKIDSLADYSFDTLQNIIIRSFNN